MVGERDPWLVLGISRSSSPESVRKAYLTLVRLHHPDRYPQGTREYQIHEDRMKEINRAYHAIVGQPEASSARTRPNPARSYSRAARSPGTRVDPKSLQCRAHGRWAVIFCRVCNAPLCSRCDSALTGLCATHRRGR